MFSFSVTDANQEKKWRDFYNSLSRRDLWGECYEYWKIYTIKISVKLITLQ